MLDRRRSMITTNSGSVRNAFPADVTPGFPLRPMVHTKQSAITRQAGQLRSVVSQDSMENSNSFQKQNSLAHMEEGLSMASYHKSRLNTGSNQGSTKGKTESMAGSSLQAHALKKPLGSLGDILSKAGTDSSSSTKMSLALLAKPLKGPSSFYFAMCYIHMMCILLVARYTGYDPDISIYRILYSAITGFIFINLMRLMEFFGYKVFTVFYLSLVPYTVLLYVSNNIAELVAAIYMIWINIILLQAGLSNPAKWMLLYWLILQAIEFLQRTTYVFIKNTCSPISACDSKVVQVVISQVGFLVAAFLVTSSFLMLSKLVELNALTLIERERFMQQLYAANLDLKRQLRIYKKDNQGIVEAPLESAINILQELSHAQMEEGLKEQVLFLVDVLSSDKLMQPDLYQNTEDTDVHDWLKDMLLSSEDQPQAREEVEDSLEIIVPKVEWNLQQVDHKLFELLEKSLDADFDIFNLETVTNGHALYYFSLHIFHKFEFGPKLKINAETFTTWISHIESNYRHSNAYHNSTHAADVAQMMLYFVTKPKLMSHLSIEELMSCLIAGIIHDYMHPGVNNAYLVATSNPLALRYNDVAVLENFHSASFFELLAAEKNMDIFASLSNDQRKNCRELIIGMVLATDMTGHFDWIGKFKARMAGTGLNFDNKQDKKLCLNLSIKAADINNATKSRQMCLQWTEMVMEEFFRQGDEEKSRGLPISPFMNRETTDIPKCQIGFIDFIVVPLYEAYAMFMGDELSVQLQNLQANKAYWKMCAEDPSKQVRMPVFTVDRSLHPPGITKSVSRNRSLNRAMTSRSPSEKERRKSREQSIKIPSTLITVTSELDVTTPPLGNTHPNLPSSSSRPNGFSAKLPTIAAESADQLSDHPHHKKLFTHLEPLQSNAPMPNSPTLGSSWRKLDPIRKDDKSP